MTLSEAVELCRALEATGTVNAGCVHPSTPADHDQFRVRVNFKTGWSWVRYFGPERVTVEQVLGRMALEELK